MNFVIIKTAKYNFSMLNIRMISVQLNELTTTLVISKVIVY